MWLRRALRSRLQGSTPTAPCVSYARRLHLSTAARAARAVEVPGSAHVEIDTETCPLGSGHFASATIQLVSQLHTTAEYAKVAQMVWSQVLSSMHGTTPNVVVVHWSKFPTPGSAAAAELSRALVDTVNPPGSTAPVPIVGCSGGIWRQLEPSHVNKNVVTADRVQLVLTAAAIPGVAVHPFHCTTSSMPTLPNMREALTSNQPHLLMFGTDCREQPALRMWAQLIDRLEMLLPEASIAGLQAMPADTWPSLPPPEVELSQWSIKPTVAGEVESSDAKQTDALTAEPPVKWSTVRFSGAELEAQLEKSFARNDAGEMVIKHSGERVEMLVAARVRARAEQREASRKKMSESLGATALGEGALLFHNEHVHTTGVTGLALFAATEDGVQAPRLTAAQFASVTRLLLGTSEVHAAFFGLSVMKEAFMPSAPAMSSPLEWEKALRKRRYVHGLPPPTKRSGTRGEGEARASDKAALFDFSDVERAMEVARVPQHVQREELLLFDFDVTLLPGAESWLRVNDGCSVAELRFFEPRYRLLMKSMVEAADGGEGERWSGRFGLHHGGVGTAAVLKWFEYSKDGTGQATVGLQGGRRFRIVPGTAYVKPFTFGLWAAEVEYFDDEDISLDRPTQEEGEEAEEEDEEHDMAKVALFVANGLNPVLKHVRDELPKGAVLPPAFKRAALMAYQVITAVNHSKDKEEEGAEQQPTYGPPLYTPEWYTTFSNAVAAILPPQGRSTAAHRDRWLQETCARTRLKRLLCDLEAFEPQKWVLMSLEGEQQTAAPWEWRKKENVAKLLRNMMSSLSRVAEDDDE